VPRLRRTCTLSSIQKPSGILRKKVCDLDRMGEITPDLITHCSAKEDSFRNLELATFAVWQLAKRLKSSGPTISNAGTTRDRLNEAPASIAHCLIPWEGAGHHPAPFTCGVLILHCHHLTRHESDRARKGRPRGRSLRCVSDAVNCATRLLGGAVCGGQGLWSPRHAGALLFVDPSLHRGPRDRGVSRDRKIENAQQQN
jgi:hypothetical protein